MKFDSVLLRDTRKFFNFISVAQPLLAKHIIPKVEKAKPVPAQMALQPEDVLQKLGSAQKLGSSGSCEPCQTAMIHTMSPLAR